MSEQLISKSLTHPSIDHTRSNPESLLSSKVIPPSSNPQKIKNSNQEPLKHTHSLSENQSNMYHRLQNLISKYTTEIAMYERMNKKFYSQNQFLKKKLDRYN